MLSSVSPPSESITECGDGLGDLRQELNLNFTETTIILYQSLMNI